MKILLMILSLLFLSGCTSISDYAVDVAMSSSYEYKNENIDKAGIEKKRSWDYINYVKNKNYILDKKQHLMWENSSSVAVKKRFVDAKKSCKNLSLAGHTDWRLPTLTEVINILDYTHYANVYPSDDFEHLRVTCYGEISKNNRSCKNVIWTDTFQLWIRHKRIKNNGIVYIVDMVSGRISTEDNIRDSYLAISYTARCVRNY
jgi:hypothetical protein